MNDELILSSCDTKEVGSFGTQLPITIRPPGFVTRTISLATSKGLGANMAAKTREGQTERVVADTLQVTRISLLKWQSVETRLGSSSVAGVNEVLGNVDSNNFSPQAGEGNRRSAISAAEVQDPQRRRDPERLHDCFPRLTHQGGNLGKDAFLPQRFVWIHARSSTMVRSRTRPHPRLQSCTSPGMAERSAIRMPAHRLARERLAACPM